MKKLSVLLIVSLFVASVFAFGNYQRPLSPTVKIELQVRVLTIMDRLNVTSSQASQLAVALLNFKSAIQPLEKQRIEDLTKLRDALLSSNDKAITDAKKALEDNARAYEKAVADLKDSLEAVVTVKQAKLFEEGLKEFVAAKGPFSDFFRFLRFNSKPTVRPPVVPKEPSKGREIKNPGIRPRPFAREDMINAIVNSEFYDLVVNTLQMKASIK